MVTEKDAIQNALSMFSLQEDENIEKSLLFKNFKNQSNDKNEFSLGLKSNK